MSDLSSGFADDFMLNVRRNPVFYYDLTTQEAVVLQQEVISALKSSHTNRLFELPKEDKKFVSEAKEVLGDTTGRYLRMPGVRSAKAKEWIDEFIAGFYDRKQRWFLRTEARKSRSIRQFSERLETEWFLHEEWLDFKAQKLMQEFTRWVNEQPIFPNYAFCSFDPAG